jgi:hypothetical protein
LICFVLLSRSLTFWFGKITLLKGSFVWYSVFKIYVLLLNIPTNPTLSAPNPSRPNCFWWLSAAKFPSVVIAFGGLCSTAPGSGGVLFASGVTKMGAVWWLFFKPGGRVVACRKPAGCMMGGEIGVM